MLWDDSQWYNHSLISVIITDDFQCAWHIQCFDDFHRNATGDCVELEVSCLFWNVLWEFDDYCGELRCHLRDFHETAALLSAQAHWESKIRKIYERFFFLNFLRRILSTRRQNSSFYSVRKISLRRLFFSPSSFWINIIMWVFSIDNKYSVYINFMNHKCDFAIHYIFLAELFIIEFKM